uniref:Envelope protein n=1 Tax=Gadus morhua TaxID=8049 RepID=A0A8C5FHC1_GADMO
MDFHTAVPGKSSNVTESSNITKSSNNTSPSTTIQPSSGPPTQGPHRHKRQTPLQAAKSPSDPCLNKYGGLSLTYTYGSSAAYTFLLCDIIPCVGGPAAWEKYDAYICDAPKGSFTGVQGNGVMVSQENSQAWCRGWGNVLWMTGKITLTLRNITSNLYQGWGNPRLGSTRACGVNTDSAYFVFGVSFSGPDPAALANTATPKPPARPIMTRDGPVTIFDLDSVGRLPTHDSIALATGYADDNAWLSWIAATVRFQGLSDCVACASARPHLISTPVLFNFTSDPIGSHCMLALFVTPEPAGCGLLSSLFPPGLNDSIPPLYSPGEYTHSCITRVGAVNVGAVPPSWCHSITNVTLWPNMTEPGLGRQDLFWSCDKFTLRLTLPAQWSGTCIIVRLLMPVTLFTRGSPGPHNHTTSRHRRNTALTDHFDLTKNTPTYMDSIGIPRGVPNQFKLADQIAAGFENIPLLSAIIPITPNKNVDRINYIHYNVQRLSNLTRDAVEGLASQLAATSLMAHQNRLALDMLLAEKGGVCSMFGAQCCTFIPNNTAPDGSVTRALAGLRALSVQMAEDSGVDNPMEKWMTDMFGKWKGLLMAVLSSLACFVGIVVCCGCCCIPCARTLCSRLITTALEKEKQQPPPYSEAAPLMPLLDCLDQLPLDDQMVTRGYTRARFQGP